MGSKRTQLDGLHRLEIPACPGEVLAAVAEAARVDVTVENFRPVDTLAWFDTTLALHPQAPVRRHRLRMAGYDIALSNAEFLELMPFWDRHGVYALFTERSPVAFRASDLRDGSRYRALRNFGFVLEFALGGPAVDGYSFVVSPDAGLVDLAERLLDERI